MNDIERFKAVVNFKETDYVPIFGINGAPGMSAGAMRKTHERLVLTGMPESVGGCWDDNGVSDLEGWYRYWGTTGPVEIDFFPAKGAKGIRSKSTVKDGFETIEYETGALVRQVVDNSITYSMPEYMIYHVRDRKSWETYRELATPGEMWSTKKLDEACLKFKHRKRPLIINMGTTWGGLRSLTGPEMACTILYDDPVLAHEIIDWFAWSRRTYLFPLVEKLRPEIIGMGEDMCYNKGMFISPAQFREFCTPSYKEIGQLSRDCGADMFCVDNDGNVMELVPLLEECGVNALYPFEVKAGNDLFKLRREHPSFIMMGGLEKEVVNEGNESMIENEIMSKVPPLLEKGGYLPNGDHGIQPFVTFDNLCRFMTLLHEVTRNPEGEFPRI